ncbi:hypothetical protein Tco_0669265 [Tanacetum coccineum]
MRTHDLVMMRRTMHDVDGPFSWYPNHGVGQQREEGPKSAASGSAQPPSKDDHKSSKKTRESDAYASYSIHSLNLNGMAEARNEQGEQPGTGCSNEGNLEARIWSSEHFDRDDNVGDDNEDTKALNSLNHRILSSPKPVSPPCQRNHSLYLSPTNIALQQSVHLLNMVQVTGSAHSCSQTWFSYFRSSKQISSGLVYHYIPSPTPNVPPTKNDWDLLFCPMLDEYFNPSPSVAVVQEPGV